MATTIKIGSVQIRDEDYAIQANAILGIRGTGKTTLAKSIAEQMLDAHIPIIVFDPTGVWRYLKRGAKRGQKGYPIVVAGGVEPDLQLTPASAAEIVRAAIKENVSLVIDLYDKKLSKGDWRRIVRDCFRTLMYENEGVRHIFLEEAAEFAPQQLRGTDGETYAEVEKVVRMGGNASLGITLINQRSQEVNKAVLELCENLILMKQRGAHAIDAIEKWIDKLEPEYAKTIKGDLPNLATGRAFVFRGEGPPVAVSANKLYTFHPDRRRPEAIKRAGKSPDVDKFVSRLGERLKDKTVLETVETLRARVKVLEKERASEVRIEISPKELHAKCAQQEKTLATENTRLKEKIKQWDAHAAKLRKRFSDIAELALHPNTPPIAPEFGASAMARPDVRAAQLKQTKALRTMVDKAVTGQTRKAEFVPFVKEMLGRQEIRGDTDELTGPQNALLKSMYWLRDEVLTLSKVAFYAGYKPARYASDRIGELRQKGLVLPKSFLISAEGVNVIADSAGEKPTGQQLHTIVRGILTGPQNAVLDALIESAGPMTLAEISEATGYDAARYLSDRVGELRRLELIVGNDKTGGAQPSPSFRE